MLHKETVERETFKLLKTLMQDKELKSFNLAGGTALALYMGHRLSIDLDLFSTSPFDASRLEAHLVKEYGFKGSMLDNNTLKGTINNVKIDCIAHEYPLVENHLITKEGIRMYSVKDITAMKLSAIADNGTRIKDFVDIACLSTKLPFFDMIESYKSKYQNANAIRPFKGLTFHDDINFKEDVQMIGGTLKWDKITKRIDDMMKCDKAVFPNLPIEPEKKTDKRKMIEIVNIATKLKETKKSTKIKI